MRRQVQGVLLGEFEGQREEGGARHAVFGAAGAVAHLLVVGTTGSGKSRLFDLLVTQAVLRGEAVVIIDPKGDQDLNPSLSLYPAVTRYFN